jgi:hypothetical protein
MNVPVWLDDLLMLTQRKAGLNILRQRPVEDEAAASEFGRSFVIMPTQQVDHVARSVPGV